MTIDVPVLVGVLGLVVAGLGYIINRDRDRKSDTKQDAQVSAQLQHISEGVNDIRIDLKASERQMMIYGERITRVEESSKQAHHRINKLEDKCDDEN
ncbi:hypothetical protein GCM10007425_27300 [Lysinibacillus alkalisoli]|uniref:Uncharacterized protein n=1 Tax=Lysinibacillus alkalisoli TaxID=1911548 RepID=A0A917G9R5_9BACI|nr:hypothetical protein [Lysinibacillus alkalisoli]GGG31190.1 hypothetical protein GCM10007425_27300 [Lysinibacillus alkalisoli]